MTVSPLAGGCLCGAVRYAIAAPIASLRVCHCTHCQKNTGSGASVNAVVAGADFAITQGTPKRFTTRADSGRTLYRYFCGDCGSPLYAHRENRPELIVVKAGTLDDSSGLKITAHIWTNSARSWSHIDPDCEQMSGNPA
jgi:hypothetical protein